MNQPNFVLNIFRMYKFCDFVFEEQKTKVEDWLCWWCIAANKNVQLLFCELFEAGE